MQTLLTSDELDKTLPFLCMGHDDSSGKICIGDGGDGVYIDWANVGRQQVFECMDQKMRAITKELGGTFIQNPLWSDMMDKKLVTVHPLGGCPMGSNGREGVINHKGEVFIGKQFRMLSLLLLHLKYSLPIRLRSLCTYFNYH